MKASAALLALLLASCAYYNGVYNARQAEQHGDRLLRKGDSTAAAARYVLAAEAAESVLANHPRSRWVGDASYLAGRGWALAGSCDKGVAHLETFLGAADSADARVPRAAVAHGRCLFALRRPADALAQLHPLTFGTDPEIAAEAALWAARAALSLREYDLAHHYLRHTSESNAEWELALAYLADGRLDEAESLLLSRAAEGDTREGLATAVAAFWRAGRRESVARLVREWDATSSLAARARLHLQAGELWLTAGEDSLALQHLLASRQLGRGGVVSEAASARITMLGLRDLPSLLDVTNSVDRSLPRSGGAPEHRRLWGNALLTRMLAEHLDHSGAALFLAGEVARDSLRAFALARTLFVQAADLHPRSPVAPKALLAVAALNPDLPWYRARLLADYPDSPFAAITRGDEPADLEEMHEADALLTASWNVVARLHADSVRRNGPSEFADEGRFRRAVGGPP